MECQGPAYANFHILDMQLMTGENNFNRNNCFIEIKRERGRAKETVEERKLKKIEENQNGKVCFWCAS